MTEGINLPFRVHSHVKEIGRSRLEVQVTVKSNYISKLYALQVKVKIPVPKNTAVCKIILKGEGKAKYNATISGILWKYVVCFVLFCFVFFSSSATFWFLAFFVGF